jgi:hypothetical protein
VDELDVMEVGRIAYRSNFIAIQLKSPRNLVELVEKEIII